MTIDHYIKSILTVIALGLLLNGLNPWIAPTKAYAELSGRDLSGIKAHINRIESDVHRISVGLCLNSKIC